MFSEFRTFLMRGSVIDLAVGVIVGASFTGIVNSLVKDILMPPIGLLLGGIDFSNFFLTLKGDRSLATLKAAQEAGAVTLRHLHQHAVELRHHRVRPVPAHSPDQQAAAS